MPDLIEVDPKTAKAWMDAGEAILIDVRELQELEEVRISGALHNPMSDFDADAVPTDASKKIIFVCAMGMRSQQVGQYLLNTKKLSAAYNMTGGTSNWAQLGLPFEHE
ncbi:MAG: rhodanese-like domain-containing protein [Rhodospirillales bacterium]|nr:rhodanese-like domain-containing protein [Rhodospirillales bacterium]